MRLRIWSQHTGGTYGDFATQYALRSRLTDSQPGSDLRPLNAVVQI